MSSVVVDTHAAVWLRTETHRLSAAAANALKQADASGDIYVSAISLIELRYLVKKGRVAPDTLRAIEDGIDDPATALRLMPVDRAVSDALAKVARADVPDMPDRIIAATATHLGLPLAGARRQNQDFRRHNDLVGRLAKLIEA